MANEDSLKIPKEKLAGLRPWSPHSLADRGAGAERRAANQPGARPLDPAEMEAERARKAAVQEGYRAGSALAAQQVARIKAIADDLQSATSALESQIAEDLVALALDLARHVLRTELSTNPASLLEVVREVLSTAPESSVDRELLLHPGDVELVRQHLGEEQHFGRWRLVADPSVGAGGCRLVTRNGEVDATLATRWQRALARMGRNDKLAP